MGDDAREPDLLALFLMALMGIVGTGVLLGMGGDLYWRAATISPGFGPPHFVSPRAIAFGVAVLFAVGLFDLIALGMMFAGGVIVVQRLRGRIRQRV